MRRIEMWRAVTGYLRRHHLALVALFIALGGTSYAAVDRIVSSPGPLYACVTPFDHELSLTTATGVCPRGESEVSWNTVGPRGPRGPRGEHGAIGLAGPAGPTGPTGATGAAGAPGAQGPAGPLGSTGAAGPAGADGKTVLNGSGAPAGGFGAIGDFYIDTTANAIYGPKAAGGWGSATSLIGPQGATGPPGSVSKQINTFGPVDVPTGSFASLIEGCTSSAFPTLIGGGYTTSPAALVGLAATIDGPSGMNDWEVVIVNNSGVTVSFTEFTVCTT
jgi:hypothetical protein